MPQSPVTEDNKQLGQGKPGEQPKPAMKDSEQRSGEAGKEAPKKSDEPGQSGGVSSEALNTAQAAADRLGSENGQTRKGVETGGKSA